MTPPAPSPRPSPACADDGCRAIRGRAATGIRTITGSRVGAAADRTAGWAVRRRGAADRIEMP